MHDTSCYIGTPPGTGQDSFATRCKVCVPSNKESPRISSQSHISMLVPVSQRIRHTASEYPLEPHDETFVGAAKKECKCFHNLEHDSFVGLFQVLPRHPYKYGIQKMPSVSSVINIRYRGQKVCGYAKGIPLISIMQNFKKISVHTCLPDAVNLDMLSSRKAIVFSRVLSQVLLACTDSLAQLHHDDDLRAWQHSMAVLRDRVLVRTGLFISL